MTGLIDKLIKLIVVTLQWRRSRPSGTHSAGKVRIRRHRVEVSIQLGIQGRTSGGHTDGRSLRSQHQHGAEHHYFEQDTYETAAVAARPAASAGVGPGTSATESRSR